MKNYVLKGVCTILILGLSVMPSSCGKKVDIENNIENNQNDNYSYENDIRVLNVKESSKKTMLIDDQFDENKLLQKINEIIQEERDKLAYDEVKVFEIQGRRVYISGNRTLSSIEEVEKYYPNLSIPERFYDIMFKSANISTKSMFSSKVENEKPRKDEVGRVYTIDINEDEIKDIILNYRNLEEDIRIHITIPYYSNEQFIYSDYIEEKMSVGDVKYTYLINEDTSLPIAICTKYLNEDKEYWIKVYKYDLLRPEKISEQYITGKKKELIKIIKQIDIKQLIGVDI